MKKQASHWKKIDHIAFALMLPFLVLEFFQHNISNYVILIVLWLIAFIYDLYEHYSEGKGK